MRHPRLLALLACTTFCLAGCQRAGDAATEAAIERASGQAVDIDRDGDRVTIATAEGKLQMQTGESLPLPADFPKDIHLPGDYAVNSVMDMGGTRVLNLNARGQVAALFEEARAGMARQGWKQTMSMQHSADNAMLAFEKDERAAVLSFNRGEGSDGVAVGVQLRDGRE